MDASTSAPERAQGSSQSLKEILARFGGVGASNTHDALTEAEEEDEEDQTAEYPEGEAQLPWDGNQSTIQDDDFSQAHQGGFTNAASSRGYGNSRVHRWKSQMVWCHWNCFKPENDETRHVLKRVANMHRADFACLRRPDKLISFCCSSEPWQSATLKFWVAITHWREAKPFFELCTMTKVAPIMPRFMVVLCAGEIQYRKAVRWVGDLRPPLPIYCLREADDNLEGRLPPQIPSHFAEVSELLGMAEDELPLPCKFHKQKPRTIIMF